MKVNQETINYLNEIEKIIKCEKEFNLDFFRDKKQLCKELLKIVKSDEFSQKPEILIHKDYTYESVVHYLNEYANQNDQPVELSGN